MYAKFIILVFLWGITRLAAEAQPAGWSLPTPQNQLSTSLIPYPAEVTGGGGTVRFSCLKVAGGGGAEQFPQLRAELEEVALDRGMVAGGKDCLPVRFVPGGSSKAAGSVEAESYTLSVSDKEVRITAAGFQGFFNGLQTLRQLIVKEKKGYGIARCTIKDTPAFSVRGVMLDVGRNFASVDFIKKLARRLSHYKINMLHLHLTDDPGWRVEVKSHPELTDTATFWKTRQPGKFYTQQELADLVDYCAGLGMRILPEVDMPGHSASFRKGVGADMQSAKGMEVLKEALDEIIPLFPDPWFHIGSDEVHFKMEAFMPEMIRYVRGKHKEVVVWSPGYVPDTAAVRMCWGENEAGHALDKSARYIDCNGFYLDWMDSQTGVPQVFFQQPCEVPRGDARALGSIFCVWTDGALGSEQRLLEQYPFYPCVLTFAERIWRGSREKRRDCMARIPSKGTEEWKAFAEFERRLVYHRDHYFAGIPFAYVEQADMEWRLIGPFDHHGQNDFSFDPERIIKEEYAVNDTVLGWQSREACGGAVQIRSLYDMFNAHRKVFRPGHWPTLMSPVVGTGPGTCYALTYIESPVDQEVWLMFGLNGMWGHSGGYRSGRAPEQGSWDYEGGDVWLNDERVNPPHWPFQSLPWTGWGRGRIEIPLTQEGYFFRPPVKIHLKKGMNKMLVRTVSGPWKGDPGDRKWQFCCMPVQWDGLHYTEVKGLKYHAR